MQYRGDWANGKKETKEKGELLEYIDQRLEELEAEMVIIHSHLGQVEEQLSLMQERGNW